MYRSLFILVAGFFLIVKPAIAQVDFPVEFELSVHEIQMDSFTGKVSDGFSIQTADRGVATIYSEPIAIPLSQNRPFTAVSLQWQAKVGNPHQVQVQLRSSGDQNEWSEWMDVEIDHHVTLEADQYSGVLVFIPAEEKYIQYRATVTPHITFTRPVIEQFFVGFINPGSTPESLLDEHLATVREQRDVRDVVREKIAPGVDFTVNTDAAYALPEYVNRLSWGNLPNTANRTPTNVTHLIVHHSAGQTTSSDFAAVVRSYYNYHTGPQLGWADIGYNWLVDPNGVIYQGRAFHQDIVGNINMNVVGAHMGGGNSNTMGICIIGNYSFVDPSEIGVSRLRTMLAWKANEFNIDVLAVRGKNVSGNTIQMHTIAGHRDGSSTECPGFRVYRQLPEIRDRVHAHLNPPAISDVQVTISSGVPEEAVINMAVDTYRANVIGFVNYGPTPENLFLESAEFTLDGSTELQQGSVTLTGLQAGIDYYYQVVAVNSDTLTVSQVGTFTAGEATSIEDETSAPVAFKLQQNFPNPFNPSTHIQFQLPESAHVRIMVHNGQGQLVDVLADRNFAAGTHTAEFSGAALSSGLYIYALEVNGTILQSRKMMLMK
jgi:hypothetical protein